MSKAILIPAALSSMLAMADASAAESVYVDMQTSYGTVTIKLNTRRAPITTENFLRYVDEHFYEGTVFHRVIKGFMNQGGGFDNTLSQKPTHEPIKLESDNGLKNVRGTIAMARTDVADSATSQFFINTVDNSFLDFDPSKGADGYAVFGKVTRGMKVIDLIADLPKIPPTDNLARSFPDLPQRPVYIDATYRYKKVTPEQAQVRIKLLGTGTGKVVSQDLGIKCSATNKRCTQAYGRGSRVVLVARPSAGSVFTQWTGDCYGSDSLNPSQEPKYVIKNLKSNMNCSARFSLPQ